MVFKKDGKYDAANYSSVAQKHLLQILEEYACMQYQQTLSIAGTDPGFLKMGFICIKVWGFAMLILSKFFI